MLLLGGGMLVTLVAVLTFAVTSLSAVRSFISHERQQIVDDRARVAVAVHEAETSLRRTVSYMELTWSTLPVSDEETYGAFLQHGNRLVIPRPAMSSGVLFIADTTAPSDATRVRRY